MAEFNPYKLEEEKWTPKNVYEILPPNSVSWSDYDFGQGTDNVDQEAANKSLIDGVIDFFGELLGTAGRILGGAVGLGIGIFSAFAEGISNFIGEIADAIDGVFTHDGARATPIRDAIVAQLGPIYTQVGTLGQHLEQMSTEVTERIDSQEIILEETQGHIDDMSTILDEQKTNLAQNQEDLDAARQETSTAIAQAGEAVSLAKSFNENLTKQITTEFNKAVGKAETAISQAEANNAELITMNTQLGTITQQASDLNTKLEEHNQKFTDGLATANTAIDEAVSVTAAVKALAEENQAKVASAISKADQANADLALLSPKVSDAVAKSDAATDNVAALTPQVSDAVSQAGAAVDKADQTLSEYTAWAAAQKTRIDSAVSKAEKATSDLAALSPQVADAVDQASKATSDVSALTPKVSEAQSRADSAYDEVGKFTAKIEEAQTKGESALAVADTAIDWLKNPVEIGTSLITREPGSNVPSWSLLADSPTTDLPPGAREGWKSRNERYGVSSENDRWVKVDPRITYEVKAWLKADVPGTSILVNMHDEWNNLAVESSEFLTPWPGGWGWVNRPIATTGIPTEWTLWHKRLTFKSTVERVKIDNISWSYGTESATGVQYIAGFEIYPEIPTQASVDKAQNDAIKANQDILAQQEEINEQQRVFNDFHTQFSKDQIEWNSAVDRSLATQETVNDNFDKWTEAATKAVEANTTAIKALTKPEIGSSLIALDADTREPHYMQWAGSPRTPSTAGLPFTKAVRVDSSTETRFDAPGDMRVPVKVNPDLTYKWSVWVYSNKPDTEITLLTTSDSIGICVDKTTYKRDNQDDKVIISKWGIFLQDIPTGWSKHEGTIKFLPATDNVCLYGVEWNKTDVANAQQWIAALDIVPDVPTQAQVDDAQFKALEAHDLLFEKQDEWNKGTKAALDAQDTVNDNFQKWTNGAAKAIEANTTAIKALSTIDTGESVIAYLTPTDAEVKAGTAEYDVPVWTTATQKKLASNHSVVESLPSPRKGVYGVEKGYGTHRANTVKVKVRPHTKYLWSFWSYGSGDLVIYMYGDGGYPVKATRQIKVNQATQEEARTEDGRRVYDSARNGNRTTSNGTQWLLSGFDFGSHGTWKYNMYEVEFTSTTTEVWFDSFYWHWNTPSTGGQYLADMQFYPDVPTQAQVDDAQNKAIQANKDLLVEQERINQEQKKINTLRNDFEVEQKKINNKQTGINALNTKADESLLQGLKALGKKSLGASLVPYKTPSDQEVKDYADGKLNYDPWADPEYFNSGYSIASNSTYGRYVRANSSQGSKNAGGTYFSVDSSIEYRIKFNAYAYTEGSILVVAMQDQDGSTAVQSTSVRDQGTMGNTGYPIHYLTLKKGWNTYSGRIKFKDTTTEARFSTFYWNHPNGVSTTQCLTNLEIVPDVPTQDDLNLSFDNNFKKIDKELGLIKSTDKSFRDDQLRWNTAARNADDALKDFDKQQVKINNLVQEQLWTQLDMIEQLDIQQPRVLHAKVTDGSLTSNIPSWVGWSAARVYDSPFLVFYHRYADTKVVKFQAKGKWEGTVKTTVNWSNGATDVWVRDFTSDMNDRTWSYGGGALGVTHRNTTFEVYPKHLGRVVGLRNTGSGWSIDESVMATGGPSLIRHQTKDEIRFTNSVVCNREVNITPPPPKGGYNITAGKVISPLILERKNFTVGVTYIFTEEPFTTNTW